MPKKHQATPLSMENVVLWFYIVSLTPFTNSYTVVWGCNCDKVAEHNREFIIMDTLSVTDIHYSTVVCQAGFLQTFFDLLIFDQSLQVLLFLFDSLKCQIQKYT